MPKPLGTRQAMPAPTPGSESDDDNRPLEERVQQQQQQQQQRRRSGDGASSSSDGGSSDGDSDDSLEAQEGEVEGQLANVPFEVLERLRQDGRGLAGPAAGRAAAEARRVKFKREHKNRPMEVTAKRPVGRFREVIQIPKQPSADPRFGVSASGHLNKEKFTKRYAFLYDEVLPEERAALKKRLKRENSSGRKEVVSTQLRQVEQQIAEEERRRKTAKLEAGWKAEERTAVAQGKRPFYLKKSEQKKRALVARYDELKKAGKLQDYMAKRRKRNAAKDHRYLPSQRREEPGE